MEEQDFEVAVQRSLLTPSPIFQFFQQIIHIQSRQIPISQVLNRHF
jgi:hypothetical protein